MKKRRKSIMVLGVGPVLLMTVLFVVLCVFLTIAYFGPRERDHGVAVCSLFFGVSSGIAAILLLAAFFRHRREDAEREEAWAKMEERERRKK